MADRGARAPDDGPVGDRLQPSLLDRLTDDELDAFLVGLRAIHRARTDLEGETAG